MEIKTFYFNPLRECCYLAWDDTRECVFIDPGNYGEGELRRLQDFVAEHQLKPVKILLTHGHFDHVLSLDEVARHYGIPVLMHPADREQIVRSQEWCQSLGLVCTPFSGTFTTSRYSSRSRCCSPLWSPRARNMLIRSSE